MLKLSSPVQDIPKIGPAKAKLLEKLNITHARDFLYTFPRKYNDYSNITDIKNLQAGQTATVKAKLKSVKSSWGFRGRSRLLRIFAELEDDTGILKVTWYNLRFLLPQLQQGRELYVAGQVDKNLQMRSPSLEFINSQDPTHTARITPIYPETQGVTSRFLRWQVKNLLPLIHSLPEYLPQDIIDQHQLISIQDAVQIIHFPDTSEQLQQAEHRLRFDELFFLQLAAEVRRQQHSSRTAYPLHDEDNVVNDLISSLPFSLTSAQAQAISEISQDLVLKSPMNRLLQGDVGSGKSAVALAAIQLCLANNYKALYLAPTEVLARQQTTYLSDVLGNNKVELLIGALNASQKNRIKLKLASDSSFCLVGTHALLQDSVDGQQVALAVIDEQHRFGVNQRQALQNINQDQVTPHLLSMTATPIPRTLNLTVFGDLDLSILDELPVGRKPIQTHIVPPSQRDQAILHILQELHAGRQAYVIAPLVEKSEKLEQKSAEECFADMEALFPDIAIGLLHGRMNSLDKASTLNNFAAGALQLLVSTSVVEVGVNVPNATIMLIEGAERFGLAQLHQFRGRVGRGQHQSYCYLFPTKDEHLKSERLQILASTRDGFEIAEADLKLRGPGEVYGAAQSGFGDLKVASLLDYELIKTTKLAAQNILQTDPELKKYPILRKKVQHKNLITHFE